MPQNLSLPSFLIGPAFCSMRSSGVGWGALRSFLVGDAFCVEEVCCTDHQRETQAARRKVVTCHTVFDLILEKKELMMTAASYAAARSWGGELRRNEGHHQTASIQYGGRIDAWLPTADEQVAEVEPGWCASFVREQVDR